MRLVVGIVGLGVLAATAHVSIISSGGYESPHAVLTIAIAAGVGVGAMVAGAAWADGRRGLSVALVVALLCGELFALSQTSERLVAQRELAQAPLRDAERARGDMRTTVQDLEAERRVLRSPRLETALETQRKVASTVAEKADAKGCAVNCKGLLDEQVKTAKAEVDAARRALEQDLVKIDKQISDARAKLAAWKAPPSGTALADRLGIAPWLFDLIVVALGSIGANGMAATLLAFAAHGRGGVSPPRTTTTMADAKNEAIPPGYGNEIESAGEETKLIPAKAGRGENASVEAEQATQPSPSSDVVVVPIRSERVVRFGNVVDFMKECCEFADDEVVIEQMQLIEAYEAWCRARRETPHDEATLGKMLDMICEQTEQTRKRHGETIYWFGVRLKVQRKKRINRG